MFLCQQKKKVPGLSLGCTCTRYYNTEEPRVGVAWLPFAHTGHGPAGIKLQEWVISSRLGPLPPSTNPATVYSISVRGRGRADHQRTRPSGLSLATRDPLWGSMEVYRILKKPVYCNIARYRIIPGAFYSVPQPSVDRALTDPR